MAYNVFGVKEVRQPADLDGVPKAQSQIRSVIRRCGDSKNSQCRVILVLHKMHEPNAYKLCFV